MVLKNLELSRILNKFKEEIFKCIGTKRSFTNNFFFNNNNNVINGFGI